MKKFISNPEISPIKLVDNKSFIFSFDYNAAKNKEIDSTNFIIKFIVEDSNNPEISNGFEISNILNEYESTINNSFTLKKIPDDKTFSYFNDELFIVYGIPYKLMTDENPDDIINFVISDNKTYVHTNLYEIYKDDNEYIQRNNEKNLNNDFIRPTEINKIENNNLSITEYYIGQENIFDSNVSKSYRIIVSNNGSLITLWIKNKDAYNKIKTFSYSNRVENANIKFEINKLLNLSNLRFTFFNSNVK